MYMHIYIYIYKFIHTHIQYVYIYIYGLLVRAALEGRDDGLVPQDHGRVAVVVAAREQVGLI